MPRVSKWGYFECNLVTQPVFRHLSHPGNTQPVSQIPRFSPSLPRKQKPSMVHIALCNLPHAAIACPLIPLSPSSSMYPFHPAQKTASLPATAIPQPMQAPPACKLSSAPPPSPDRTQGDIPCPPAIHSQPTHRLSPHNSAPAYTAPAYPPDQSPAARLSLPPPGVASQTLLANCLPALSVESPPAPQPLPPMKSPALSQIPPPPPSAHQSPPPPAQKATDPRSSTAPRCAPHAHTQSSSG